MLVIRTARELAQKGPRAAWYCCPWMRSQRTSPGLSRHVRQAHPRGQRVYVPVMMTVMERID